MFCKKCKPKKCTPKKNYKLFIGISALALIASFAVVVSLDGLSLKKLMMFNTKASGTVIFTQNDWTGGADQASMAVLPGDAAGWNKYYSTEGSVNTSSAGRLAMDLSISKWQNGGLNISSDALQYMFTNIIPDGNGNTIMAMFDNTNADLVIKKVNPSGGVMWEVKQLSLYEDIGSERDYHITPDGFGGVVVVWGDYRNYNGDDIYAQRIDSSGNLIWGSGVVVCAAQRGQGKPMIIQDGNGGFIVSWFDSRNWQYHVYAQKLDSSGSFQWATDGVKISTNNTYRDSNSKLVSDGSGGAIVVWDGLNITQNGSGLFAQRISSSGSLQWAEVTINGGQDPQITSDGSNGVIVTWSDDRVSPNDNNVYAQRVDSSGAIKWQADGVGIATTTSMEVYSKIVSDGNGGAIISWADDRNTPTTYNIYAQKIDSSGSLIWNPAGVAVSNYFGQVQFDHQIASDGNGGAIIVWNDFRSGMNSDIYGQDIDSFGNTLWGADGLAIATKAAGQSFPVLTTAETGSAITAWEDYSMLNTQIYAQKLGPLGYSGSSSLVSSIINTGAQTDWGTIDWTANTPAGTSITLQTRTAAADPITNIILNKNLSSSSGEPNYPFGDVSNIADGDREFSGWQSEDNGSSISPSNPQWVAVDFASPTKVSKVDLWYGTKMYPVDFDIQVCVDDNNCEPTVDSDWNTVQQVIGNNSNNHFSISFSTVETRKLRLHITKQVDEGAVNTVAINEFEIYSGAWSDWQNHGNSGEPVGSPTGQYIQYKTILMSNDPNSTPEINSISISNAAPTNPAYVSGLVTSAGATLTTPDTNASITVPAGALSTDTTISIDGTGSNFMITGPFGIYDGLTSYEFSPDGLTFNSPVTITLKIDKALLDSLGYAITDVHVFFSPDAGNTWADHDNITDTGISGSNYYITFTTTHFTRFALGVSVKAAILATGDLHVVYSKDVVGFAGIVNGKEKKSAKTSLIPGPVGDSRGEVIDSVNTKVYTQAALITALGSKDFDKKVKAQCASIYDGNTATTKEAAITKSSQYIILPKIDNYITATRVVISDPVDSSTHTTTICRKLTSDKFNFNKGPVAKMNNKVMKSVKVKCSSKDANKICVAVDPGDEDFITTPANLNLTYPESVVWGAGVNSHSYEFVLESTTNWTVKACASMPSGYKVVGASDADGNPLTVKSNCVTGLVVNNGSTVITFDVQGLTTASAFDTKFTFEGKYGTNTTKIEKIIKNTRLK